MMKTIRKGIGGSLIVCGLLVVMGYFLFFGTSSAQNYMQEIDLSKFTTTSNSSADLTVDSHRILIRKNSDKERANFVSTSPTPFDFTRNFSIRGTLKTANAPDGMTFTFQPDAGFRYRGGEGSCLLVYNLEDAADGDQTYASNALIAEVDTYYLKVGTDMENEIAGIGGPHLAISTLGENGKSEYLRDSAAFEGGGEKDFLIRWELTDEEQGIGTYTFQCGEKTLSYKNFKPEELFGSSRAYFSLTGSLNFESGYGGQNASWGIEMDSFSYDALAPAETNLSAEVHFDEAIPKRKQTSTLELLDAEKKLLQSKEYDGNRIAFDPLTFEDEGEYTFYVQQRGLASSVDYDTEEKEIHVAVTREGNHLVANIEGDARFENKAFAPEIVLSETSSQATSEPVTDKIYTYTITVKNKGKGDAIGVYIRRYMPDYTNCYEVLDGGEYGYVHEKEHATWFIPELASGKEVRLQFRAQVHECRPKHAKLGHHVLYEVTGSEKAPRMNGKTDPKESYGEKATGV